MQQRRKANKNQKSKSHLRVTRVSPVRPNSIGVRLWHPSRRRKSKPLPRQALERPLALQHRLHHLMSALLRPLAKSKQFPAANHRRAIGRLPSTAAIASLRLTEGQVAASMKIGFFNVIGMRIAGKHEVWRSSLRKTMASWSLWPLSMRGEIW